MLNKVDKSVDLVPDIKSDRISMMDRFKQYMQADEIIPPNMMLKVKSYLAEPMIDPKKVTRIKEYLAEPIVSKATIEKIQSVEKDIKNKVVDMMFPVDDSEDISDIVIPPKTRGSSKLPVAIQEPSYVWLEVEPSKLTSNMTVKWLFAEIARLYTPIAQRLSIQDGRILYQPEATVWWEVFIHKNRIRFFLAVPSADFIKDSLTKQVMKTWKQSNVMEKADYLPDIPVEQCSITTLTLEHHSILSIDTDNPIYSPLDSVLNAKRYLGENDMALLQIGLSPVGEEWNKSARDTYDRIKTSGSVPRKKGKEVTVKEIAQTLGLGVGLVSEELTNLLGDFLIPGWENNTALLESTKTSYGEGDARSTRNKLRSEGFRTSIRLVGVSEDSLRRKAIIRALSTGFDQLEGDNKFVENIIRPSKLENMLSKVKQRQHNTNRTTDILCSLELAKIVQVPDMKSQAEHYNELTLVQNRGEIEVPSCIFTKDEGSIPFMQYGDADGSFRHIYFSGKNKNFMCMPRVVIGEPGSGKTTWAISFSLDAFHAGYGCFCIDASDGKMVQRILSMVKPEELGKVKIIDCTNTDFPIGLGWNEAFILANPDIIEDLLVEEVIYYIELASSTELNMRAKIWIENAVKATYTNPDATLQDIENMLNNTEYRNNKTPMIEDPQLRADWEYYSTKLTPNDRKAIYDEAFRRLSPVMRKKTLKNFVLQKPKKNDLGEYAVNIRKWMDEGYLVLVKANETLGETLQTALVSFLLAKFNLAIVTREDIVDEEQRKPCFLILDEPDHYIKGSERWRNMLTRYRKYHCGVIMMFHGWQQLTEKDKKLPAIIRKSGPHYIIFQTDEDNLLELQSIVEPEFRVRELAKGMPKQNAVVKLKMYNDKGESIPAFMAKALPWAEDRFQVYDNNSHYDKCARELGRPKLEVMEEIFRYKNGSETDDDDDTPTTGSTTTTGEVDIDIDYDGDNGADDTELKAQARAKSEAEDELEAEEKREKLAKTKKKMVYEVGNYIEDQIARGEEPDIEIIKHMDELLEEG
jgi:hypothetical protein